MSESPESGRATESPTARAFARDVTIDGMYIGATLQQRLDLIEHLIEFGRQIIVLNGGKDSGKSTLLDYFSTGSRSSWYPVRVQGAPGLSTAMLTSALLDELDVNRDQVTDDTASQQLRTRIAALERSGKVVVLMLDDAEQLRPDTIAFIVSLAHSDDQFAELRVLLAADLDQSALLDSLQRAHPQHGLVHVVEIPRLADNQIQPLIEQRMRAVGLDAAEYFAAQDYARIGVEADGWIGRVITLGRQHLAGASTSATLGTSRQRMAGGRGAGPSRSLNVAFMALAGLAVVGGAWWATRNPLTPSSVSTEQIELEPDAVVPADPVAAPASADSPSEPLESPDTEDASPPMVDVVEAGPDGMPTAPDEAPIAPSVPTEKIASPPSGTLELLPQPMPPPKAEDLAVAVMPPTEPLTSTEPSISARKPESAVTPPAPPTPPVPKVAVPPPKVEPVARPPAPKVAAAPSRSAPAALKGFSGDWLLKQPATGHTLQLFGVRTREAAERFRRQRGITGQSAVVTSTLNGQPWFIVVYGFYPTRSAALNVTSNLPAPLRGTKPWARSIGSLRDALR